jgi:hypothetical protein
MFLHARRHTQKKSQKFQRLLTGDGRLQAQGPWTLSACVGTATNQQHTPGYSYMILLETMHAERSLGM